MHVDPDLGQLEPGTERRIWGVLAEDGHAPPRGGLPVGLEPPWAGHQDGDFSRKRRAGLGPVCWEQGEGPGHVGSALGHRAEPAGWVLSFRSREPCGWFTVASWPLNGICWLSRFPRLAEVSSVEISVHQRLARGQPLDSL